MPDSGPEVRDRSTLIGASVPRERAKRLVVGRGRYTDDIHTPGLLHAAFLRSPYAHAKILSVDVSSARQCPGVQAIYLGQDLVPICPPWTARLGSQAHHRSAPQPPMAVNRAVWQGQPVALVIAESRALAEDAVALIDVLWQPLEPIVESVRAASSASALIHGELGTNVCFERSIDVGNAEQVFRDAKHVVRRHIKSGRHTGVPLEARAVIADYDSSLRRLTIHQSTQIPHEMRAVYSELLGIPECDIRIIVPDVGGGFGVKMHLYDDEIAAIAAGILLGRPVKYSCDRLEAFTADIHARSHTMEAAIAFNDDGKILGFEIDDICELGAFSIYPRTSAPEAWHAISMVGAPYAATALRGRTRAVFVNKAPVGAYRGVGQPIACMVTESLMDAAARELSLDVAEIRLRNIRKAGVDSATTAGGIHAPDASHELCLRRLLEVMDYEGLRAEQLAAREQGRYLGIGLACFLEVTAPGSSLWGPTGMHIPCGDGCTIRLEPTGEVTCITSSTDQGQGSDTGISQIVAEELGVPVANVRIIANDTAVTAVGGGTWASRALTIGGEAALTAARMLRERLALIVAACLDTDPARLRFADSLVWDMSANRSMSLEEIGKLLHYHPHNLPQVAELSPLVTHYHVPARPYVVPNGAQASFVEVDIDSGFVKPLRHWVVEDCGRVINPLLVDEQLRGGVIQGLGGALLEECVYDDQGQLLTSTLADYLVPMSMEMPDVVVEHVIGTPPNSLLGVKGVGEAGTIGAAAALLNAVNDAINPLNGVLAAIPCTPERVLRALRKI